MIEYLYTHNPVPAIVSRTIFKLSYHDRKQASIGIVLLGGSQNRGIDLPGFLQEFCTADAEGHPFSLLAQVDRISGETVLECRRFFWGSSNRHGVAPYRFSGNTHRSKPDSSR
ncbi:hypothetical protein ACKN7S_00780 (plasmid) [Bradyrhizobium sp. RDM4]